MYNSVMLFVFGLLLLIKGGDWFVDSATGIAKRFRIPELIIGATVVSIGTTLPEVMVSAMDAVGGDGGTAYGNAIGSIICNTALIAAITIAVRPAKVDRKTFIMPVLFFFGAAMIYLISAYFLGEFSRVIGIVLLAVFVVYMVITVIKGIKADKHGEGHDALDQMGLETPEEEAVDAAMTPKQKRMDMIKDIVLLVVGAAVIALGADLLVDNGIIIAQALGVPSAVIGLTFIAIGTSLPELVTAINSLVKGHGALSLGNIIGANLFNLVLVSGVAITLSPFAIPSENMLFGVASSLVIDLPIMLGAMLLLTVPALVTGKIKRWQGIALLGVYVAFFALQFII
ncbi:MAG: calcium/sodium antiporter [Clostridia bacterium]|nr:calcium/sodium antiporter [Clostridia bacterium]